MVLFNDQTSSFSNLPRSFCRSKSKFLVVPTSYSLGSKPWQLKTPLQRLVAWLCLQYAIILALVVSIFAVAECV